MHDFTATPQHFPQKDTILETLQRASYNNLHFHLVLSLTYINLFKFIVGENKKYLCLYP